MSSRPLIAPSLLSGDFSRLGQEIVELTQAGADWIHLDVMDGHFVPNMTFGPRVIQDLRKHSPLPFDVHLMMAPVDPYIESFAQAGADHILIHPEAGPHLHRSLQLIKKQGKRAGVVFNPATPLTLLPHVLELIDGILIMTVNPGFGGQTFIEAQLPKIREARAFIETSGRPIWLAVDGGITPETAVKACAAGADVLIAGTSVFQTPTYAKNIDALRGGGT